MTNQKEKRKVPELRFPEFSGEWEKKYLCNVANAFIGLTYSPSDVVENGTLVLRSSNVQNNQLSFNDNVYVDASIPDILFIKKDDILLCSRNGSRALIGKSALVKEELLNTTFGAFMTVIRSHNNKFLHQLFNTSWFYNQIHQNLGATINQITTGTLNKMYFFFPGQDEQQKIGEFFSKLDRQIELEEKKLALLEEQKKGYMQKIFSQELRFKDENGADYPEWDTKRIIDILQIRKREIEKPKDSYTRLGLRSHGKGTFYENVEDPSKVAMDKLYVVKENDFIINITFAWEQALAIAEKSDENKLVSHRFPTFVFNNGYEIEFFKYYFLSKRFKYMLNNASPGGAGRNKVLNISQFNKIQLNIPCDREQLVIGTFLSLLTKNIEKQIYKLQNLRKRKSYFLSKNFI